VLQDNLVQFILLAWHNFWPGLLLDTAKKFSYS